MVVTLVGLFAALLARGPLESRRVADAWTHYDSLPDADAVCWPHTHADTADTGADTDRDERAGTPDPCAPTPPAGATPTATPAQANAYEQLGWTAASGVKQGQIPRVVFSAAKPSVGYACTAGPNGETQISKTTDSGATWKFMSSPIRELSAPLP